MENKFKYIMDNCEKCKGKGYLFNISVDKNKELKTTADECECHKKMVQNCRLDKANVPIEYYNLDFKNDFMDKSGTIKKDIDKVLNNINDFYRKGQCLYLHGTNGNGKTFAAVEILKKACMEGYSIYYDWFPVIIDLYTKKGYKAYDEQREYDEIIEKADFLVVDELGKESENGAYTKSDICRFLEINILKKRSSKVTIIVSNLFGDIKTLGTNYSQSILSVMDHRFHPIHFQGTDYRRGTGKTQANVFFQENN